MTTSTSSFADLRASISGSKIFTIMGGGWMAYGLIALASIPVWMGVLLPLLAISLTWYFLTRHGSRFLRAVEGIADDNGTKKAYNIVNGAQGILIFLAVQVVNNIHAPQFLPVAFS